MYTTSKWRDGWLTVDKIIKFEYWIVLAFYEVEKRCAR